MGKGLLPALLLAATVTLALPAPAVLAQGGVLENLLQAFTLSSLSDRQEVQLGSEINRQLVRSGQIRLVPASAALRRVQDVAAVVAQASDRPNIPYTVQVVADKSINAFATMGGYVYVTTGLLRAVDNDAQLAGVLAHEMGHIAAKHALRQMKDAAITQAGEAALGLEHSALVNIGAKLFFLRYSRADEYEADRRGLFTLARTPYPPRSLPDFLRKLENLPSNPEFLSSHPSPPNRVKKLEQLIAQYHLDRNNGGRL
ncbi:M48 family metallopeptidase [Gloeobacter kilaueensis]|uniref:Peptidase M48 Ste24p n=1 Tax=Gloeobacter kilaueensis (strain ATCC BAA-2537 / CCAP 1431/1 / ULC 316 / JS1) TaxID=1183438 RepID=U5QKM9_GLOK1|nr:M48 family metallopeptidase [Gloeobacter kilaueensis]AGY59537.1 peptidase M48 Ste24p [Gloeobacter kilaueensis JS1]